ncbi:MAG: phosphatase PAP2 family protein [Elainellaceae cyanobacterium]
MKRRSSRWVIASTISSMGRLALGVHWPSDIFAGWIIGGAWALRVVVAFERATAIAERR